MRSSAGPIAEAHLTILHDLENIEPENSGKFFVISIFIIFFVHVYHIVFNIILK
jgi:hypothetical protein